MRLGSTTGLEEPTYSVVSDSHGSKGIVLIGFGWDRANQVKDEGYLFDVALFLTPLWLQNGNEVAADLFAVPGKEQFREGLH